MPSTSKKQAKTMSAIAHGWHPPAGSAVAKIPVSVAKEFHAADAGSPYGAKHKASKGSGKFKTQYHAQKAKGSIEYAGYGGGISQGKRHPMPIMDPPEVMAWPTEHRKPPHQRDAVERDHMHQGGYRSHDPDHPQEEPHHHLRDGTGFIRHVAQTSYPSPVSIHRHMQGTAGGHQIGGHSPRHGAHTFRGMRTRHGK
jgi:hypothetical protein